MHIIQIFNVIVTLFKLLQAVENDKNKGRIFLEWCYFTFTELFSHIPKFEVYRSSKFCKNGHVWTVQSPSQLPQITNTKKRKLSNFDKTWTFGANYEMTKLKVFWSRCLKNLSVTYLMTWRTKWDHRFENYNVHPV